MANQRVFFPYLCAKKRQISYLKLLQAVLYKYPTSYIPIYLNPLKSNLNRVILIGNNYLKLTDH